MIGRILDLGADGILAQEIRTGTEAATVVRYTNYPPLAVRRDDDHIGAAADRARELVDHASANTVKLAIVESEDGVTNIDEICETDGVDAVWVGPSDLSLSMGIPGDS